MNALLIFFWAFKTPDDGSNNCKSKIGKENNCSQFLGLPHESKLFLINFPRESGISNKQEWINGLNAVFYIIDLIENL